MKVGIVAGEPSGDYLGAGLMGALKDRLPQIEFVGIGGTRMENVGMQQLYSMNRISIMGLDELLKSIYDILKIRRNLFELFSKERVALFIGVDVPDFNLGLEQRLRKSGIATVHYVSPTVWAWRSYRIRKIKRAVSHMLTLFPFEADFYKQHSVPVSFVGHPIADEIDIEYRKADVRQLLGLDPEKRQVVALLPGSRLVEVKRLGGLFIQTAQALKRKINDVQFVAPFANEETMHYFSTLLASYPDLHITIVQGKSRQAIAASDVALVASGTAALESALLRVPLIVAYRGSWVSYSLVKMLAHVEHFSMPNNLLHDPIVPELIQSSATVENLVNELTRYLTKPEQRQLVENAFSDIISSLRCNANEKAATVISKLLENHT